MLPRQCCRSLSAQIKGFEALSRYKWYGGGGFLSLISEAWAGVGFRRTVAINNFFWL